MTHPSDSCLLLHEIGILWNPLIFLIYCYLFHTDFLDYFEPQISEYNELLTYNKIFIERTADVGVLPADVAVSFGVTGPNLRGSGVKWDVRRDEPYSIYDRFEFDVPTGTGEFGTVGDCFDRYWVRMLEVKESVKTVS